MFIISYVKIKIILNRSMNNSIIITVVLDQITPTKGGIKNTVKTILLNMFYKQFIKIVQNQQPSETPTDLINIVYNI